MGSELFSCREDRESEDRGRSCREKWDEFLILVEICGRDGLRVAKALCYDMRTFEFSKEKTLAIENPGVTIQKKKNMCSMMRADIFLLNHSCREKWDIACHLRCIV